MSITKKCKCCNKKHYFKSIDEIPKHDRYVGIQSFGDHGALHMFNCSCDSTLCVKIPKPKKVV